MYARKNVFHDSVVARQFVNSHPRPICTKKNAETPPQNRYAEAKKKKRVKKKAKRFHTRQFCTSPPTTLKSPNRKTGRGIAKNTLLPLSGFSILYRALNKSPVIFANNFPAVPRPCNNSSILSANGSSPRSGKRLPRSSNLAGRSTVESEAVESGEPDRFPRPRLRCSRRWSDFSDGRSN